MDIECEGPRSAIGEICTIKLNNGKSILAEVVGLEGKIVRVTAFGDTKGIEVGCEVIATGAMLQVPVGMSLLGRVVDATGHAYDEGEVTTAPGCETKGTKTFTCQNDASHTYTEEIPAEVRTYYSDYLIDNAEPALVHDRFAQKHNIPAGGGSGGGLPEGGKPNTMLVTDGDGNAKWEARTHWKEEGLIDVLPEVTINVADFGEDASELPIMQPFSAPVVVGEEYVVTYNGAEYTTTAFELQLSAEAPPLPALGNQGAIGGEDTGEPFIILYLPDEFKEMAGGVSGMLIPMDGAALITLKIQRDGVEYHKLDPGYLPIPMTGGMVDILPETTLPVNEDEGVALFFEPLPGEIVIGNVYTVTYNGSEYVCTAWAAPAGAGGEAPALGNKSMIGEDDTGEPFAFMHVPPDMLETTGGIHAMLMPFDGSAEVTVSIRGEVAVKIDNSALDMDWIPKKGDVGAVIIPLRPIIGLVATVTDIADRLATVKKVVAYLDGKRYECCDWNGWSSVT